jgi:PAS domain S-box-containing protein
MFDMNSFLHSKDFVQFCHKVFDNLPIAIDFLDKDGRLIYINKAFRDFLGIPDKDVTGMMVTDVNSTSRFPEVLRASRQKSPGDINFRMEGMLLFIGFRLSGITGSY